MKTERLDFVPVATMCAEYSVSDSSPRKEMRRVDPFALVQSDYFFIRFPLALGSIGLRPRVEAAFCIYSALKNTGDLIRATIER